MEKAIYKEDISEEYFRSKLRMDKAYEKYYEEKVKNLSLSLEEKYKFMIEKGYFISDYKDINDLLSDYKLNYRTTYLFDERLLKKDMKNIFLLSCGGFSPVHEGHINMMKLAKESMEKENNNVVGGYISPSHDIYVDSKRNGEASLNIYKRIDLLEKRLCDDDFLYVDKWEGTVCRKEVNYTVVIERLQKYLEASYRGYDVEVVFVYGSDNRVFGEVLEVSGISNVCVSRCEGKILSNPLSHQLIINEGVIEESSEDVRRRGDFNVRYEICHGLYEVREDSIESMKHLTSFLSAEKLKEAKESILELIKESVNEGLEVRELSVVEQVEKFEDMLSEIPRDVSIINLDVYLEEGLSKGVSRYFNINDGQLKAEGLVSRCGNKDLKSYFKDIEKGRYIIVDDDKASGFTYEEVSKNLSKEVEVYQFVGLNDLVRSEIEVSYDVVDMRDFIVGSLFGGLCVQLKNGDICRVPYVEPYVNLMNRASILPEKISDFTKGIWLINYNLYKDSEVRLSNLPDISRRLFIDEGYAVDDLLCDILKDKL